MNHFLGGFADELGKQAGVLGALGKSVAKNPFRTLGLAMIPAAAGMAAYQGYKSGRSGAKTRYLAASPGRPSPVAHTNFNRLFPKAPTEKQKRRLTKHHRPEAFK